VGDDGPAPGQQIKNRLRKAPEVHEILRDYLQPADRKVGLLQFMEVLFAQTDAGAEGGEG